MAKQNANDTGKVEATETAEVKTYTQNQVDELIRANREGNPTPAVEEGPHLKGDVAKLKREQLHEAGVTADDDTITEDMRRLIAEEK